MLIYLQLMESDEDKQRFTALYEAHHARVEQIALHILQDPHDAEDAVQNTFFQIIRHFEKIYEIPCDKLHFWIVSIVKNESLTILRKKKRTLSTEDWDDFPAPPGDSFGYRELVRLFSALPETYRTTLELYFLAGYSCREIAQSFGISESTVTTRVSRGRKLLRDMIEKEGFYA